MPLLNILGRWTSRISKNNASDSVTLEPTPSPHAYPSPHSRPFQPRPQGEAEARRWLANPTPVASYLILHARDRAVRHLSVAQRTHAATETRRWVRAPTDGNLRQILQRRDDAGGAPVLGTPSFPSLRKMVVEAGVELGADGSPVEGRMEISQPLTSQVEVPSEVEVEEGVDQERRGRTSTRTGGRGRSTRAGRGAPWYVHLRPRLTEQEQEQERSRERPRSRRGRANPEEVRPEQEQTRGRPRSRRGRRSPEEARPELSDLPPRPSCVPGNYGVPNTSRFSSEDDEHHAEVEHLEVVEQPADVEIGTALPGRVTRSQRMFSVSRPGPVPEEYRTWALASSATFDDVRSGDGESSGSAKSSSDSDDEGNDGDDEYDLGDWARDAPQGSPDREEEPSSSGSGEDWGSSSSDDLWLHEPTQQDLHLQEIRKALGFHPRTTRRRIESWFYSNPSALYHILTGTVPHPGLAAQGQHLSHSAARLTAMEDLEWNIRRGDWALIKLDYVDRRRRIVRKGPRVEKKVLGRPRWLKDEDEVSRQRVPSRLRFCETVG